MGSFYNSLIISLLWIGKMTTRVGDAIALPLSTDDFGLFAVGDALFIDEDFGDCGV